jgi:prepilin-type N-terminal cleavage/methylation domain-containing protein
MKDKRGFTLIELLIAITIGAILSTTVMYIFKVGLDSWEIGQGQALTQLSTEIAVSRIVEGDYFYDGLREALDITSAKPSEVWFIPWFVQDIENVRPNEKYNLKKTLLKGASVPIGEVYDEKKKEFIFANLDYFYENQSGVPREFIVFKYVGFHVAQTYRQARVVYYPDPRQDEQVIMKIYFDPSRKMIFRKYMGVEKPLFRGEGNIVSLKMKYYNNSNQELDTERIDFKKSLTSPITAVEVEATAETGSETYTMRSFVNIRKKGIAGTGIYLTENALVNIPDSKNIKILTLTNFGGITKNSKAEINIRSKKNFNQSYKLNIFFDNIDGAEYLTGYSVEYPEGEVVLSKEVNKPASYGLNLLTLDPSGNYDYDNDDKIEDIVDFEGNDVELSVSKMEIGGMNLFVK